MRAFDRRVLWIMVLVLAGSGCSREGPVPDELTIYSIDGRSYLDRPQDEPSPVGGETFHGFPILGKVAITDRGERRKVWAAIQDGMSGSDGQMAKCFRPRHGVRVVEGGKVVDYVVCFECFRVDIHTGEQTEIRGITRDAQPILDRHLTAAGVPLVPKPAVSR